MVIEGDINFFGDSKNLVLFLFLFYPPVMNFLIIGFMSIICC